MNLGLISDIHGRFDALEMAYGALINQVDRIVCLGDVVDGGDDTEQCISFLREHEIETVCGNHDSGWVAVQEFSRDRVQNLRWMDALPAAIEVGELHLVHDDPTVIDLDRLLALEYGGKAYLRTFDDILPVFTRAKVFAPPARGKIVAVGHTHRPAAFYTGAELSLQMGNSAYLDPGQNWIINPGTVGGKPRSAWGNTYAVLDTDSRMFTVYQLDLPKLPNLWDKFFDSIYG